MLIDLHTHSTASDGTCTPAELVTAAADAGLDVVAITDHDTTFGWAAAEAALPSGLTLVRGAELSCRWYGTDPYAHSGSRTSSGEPEQAPIALHLLAYLFDPGYEPLAWELRRVQGAREHRAEGPIDLPRADGRDLAPDEGREGAGGGPGGPPPLPP